MAKNETPKSKAELYREERKARIAKASKQNAKNIEKRNKVSKAAKIAVAAVLAVVIVGLVVFNALKPSFTALEVGGTKISAAQFNYYYSVAFNDISSQASQLQQYYGSDVLGFDSSLPPDEQESTEKDEDGNPLMWSEVIKDRAITIAQQTIGYYNEAVAAGITLTEDQEAEISETIESYRTEAANNNFTLNAYLKLYFGAGFNEKELKKLLETQLLADAFTTQKSDEIDKSITDKDLEKEYKENKKDYDYTDVRYYTISFKKLTAKDGESEDALKKRQKEANDKLIAEAKDIIAKATDDNTLIEEIKTYNKSEKDTTKKVIAATYSSLKSSVSEKGADWAYAKDRKAGDMTVVSDDSAAYIILMLKPAYTSNSVSVRHCLVAFDAKDSNNVTDTEKKEAFKKAEKLLKDLGDKVTEDAFSKMATQNTEDEGSAATGGLYANIRISDNYVESFEEWSFDSARKAGDTGIVETEYGYHIMYFVSDNTDDVDWKNTIKNAKSDEALKAFQDEIFAEDGKNAIEEKETWTNYVVKEYCDKIRKTLAYSQMG